MVPPKRSRGALAEKGEQMVLGQAEHPASATPPLWYGCGQGVALARGQGWAVWLDHWAQIPALLYKAI